MPGPLPISVTGGAAAPSSAGASSTGVNVGGLSVNTKPNYTLMVGLALATVLVVRLVLK